MATGAEADPASLAALLKDFRELPPKVRTRTRRQLRTVGDDVIAEQRAILDGALPRGIAVKRRTVRLTRNRKTGRAKLRLRNVYGEVDVKHPGRSTGMRERIKAGLVTRIVTGKTRQGIDVRTQSRKAPMSRGWNSKRFRHPVFKTGKWADQQGQPYFFRPVMAGRDEMVARATDVLNEVIEGK